MNTLFDKTFSDRHNQLLNDFNAIQSHMPRSELACNAFVAIIKHYHDHKRRSFPWRDTISPYRTVVSEIMLQQTQTTRVIQKFDDFITRFPNFKTLANAPFQDILRLWKGLGYNRRALALHKIAQSVVWHNNSVLPDTPEILETFPGIGPATARSIITFAFNTPTAFIETNIRTVFIYFFFKESAAVHDKDIMPLIEQTVDQYNPREWYYALMDYGVMLKKEIGNISRLSAHYTKQSKFDGSDRQIRGMILQTLLNFGALPENAIVQTLQKDPLRVKKILNSLCREGLVQDKDNMFRLE